MNHFSKYIWKERIVETEVHLEAQELHLQISTSLEQKTYEFQRFSSFLKWSFQFLSFSSCCAIVQHFHDFFHRCSFSSNAASCAAISAIAGEDLTRWQCASWVWCFPLSKRNLKSVATSPYWEHFFSNLFCFWMDSFLLRPHWRSQAQAIHLPLQTLPPARVELFPRLWTNYSIKKSYFKHLLKIPKYELLWKKHLLRVRWRSRRRGAKTRWAVSAKAFIRA